MDLSWNLLRGIFPLRMSDIWMSDLTYTLTFWLFLYGWWTVPVVLTFPLITVWMKLFKCSFPSMIHQTHFLSSTFMPFAMYNMILVLLFSELLWIYSMKILNQSIICILFNVSPFFPPKYLILSSVLFLLISYFFSLILRRIQIFMSFV